MEIPSWMREDVPEQPREFGIATAASNKHVATSLPRGDAGTWNSATSGQQNRPVISCENTTIIGDYSATVFPEYCQKWLVQAIGNNTFGSVTEAIKKGEIAVNRKYIFIALGGNQVRTCNVDMAFNIVLDLTVTIREKNPDSRLFIVAVLPRPVDNNIVKPMVAKFNRWISLAAERVSQLFGKVKFLPVQIKFITGSSPITMYFNHDDNLTLNQAGAALYRKELFRLAGFVQNEK